MLKPEEALGAIGELLVKAAKGDWRTSQAPTTHPAIQLSLWVLSDATGAPKCKEAADRSEIAALYVPFEAKTRGAAA